MALSLFLVARIGFRAISRVFQVLCPQLGLVKAPCAQTVINWVARLSIVRTQLDSFCSKDSIWLIDLSIGLGAGKILSVLHLDLKHHEKNEYAPSLKNVECLGVSVAASWTGEAIADFLTKVIASVGGAPCAFLKDGGSDLGKSVRLLGEQGTPCLSIADISHTIANLFKHKYGKHPLFDIFVSACSQVSKNLKQTLLASLAPPKIAINARFMNLHTLVTWANKLLQHSPQGNAETGSMLAKLRAGLDLPACKTFITQFLRDATPMLACQKILKHKGLNQETYQVCQTLITAIPPSSSIRKGFEAWAIEQLAIATTLKMGSTGLPISTDSLESLYGVGKRLGTGQTKDADRIASRLPAFCGTLSLDDVQKVLSITVKEQQAVMQNKNSLTKQRRDVLDFPGMIETLAQPTTRQNIQLIGYNPGNKPNIVGAQELFGQVQKIGNG